MIKFESTSSQLRNFSRWSHDVSSMNYIEFTCDYYDLIYINLLIERITPLETNKFLLITDIPLPCTDKASILSARLRNFTYYDTGSPLTVIAIDKINDNSVANSYKILFPPTQMPNLYQVNRISELFSNINKTINICLDFVPWLEVKKLSSYRTVWYFYVIGSIILLSILIILIVFIIIVRKKTRKKLLDEIQQRMEMVTTNTGTSNTYEYNSLSNAADIWEIPLKSLEIYYKVLIGKGAFSAVYSGLHSIPLDIVCMMIMMTIYVARLLHQITRTLSGFIHGKAPVLNIYPSISLQTYVDCEVAVKTLPLYYKEADKVRFRNEINLMKEIGYHIHLVNLLGCNCSIERPFLVMELAEQSLLQWLMHAGSSTSENQSSFEKLLLSITWQVADGMVCCFYYINFKRRSSYLSSIIISWNSTCHKIKFFHSLPNDS